MTSRRIIVAGGGAAGFFAAITCAEAAPGTEMIVLEKGSEFLTKVRISGGGRCNVTHACSDPAVLSTYYPRGGRALIGAFHRFQPSDTIAWFEARGVKLKTEADGRIFPVTDSSQTVITCLVNVARSAGVKLFTHRGIASVMSRHTTDGGGTFEVVTADGETLPCERLLLATGGCRTAAMAQPAVSLGHTLEPPVPSLFSFHIETPWLRELPGVSVENVEATVPGTSLRARGPLLITHSGMSGPAILRLSAWGARILYERNYHFPLHINWLPRFEKNQLTAAFDRCRTTHGAKRIVNTPIAPLTARLWERLVVEAGIAGETRWSSLPRLQRERLEAQLLRSEFSVTGKSLNKEEFVTCGGVRLSEVNFQTMESRIRPGLHFAGELLDIDGITGGFNFQAAWTTGWLAGQAMARG